MSEINTKVAFTERRQRETKTLPCCGFIIWKAPNGISSSGWDSFNYDGLCINCKKVTKQTKKEN